MRKPFWSWDNTLQRLGFRRVKKASRSKPLTSRRMTCEALEPREMLAQTFSGTTGDDFFEITVDGSGAHEVRILRSGSSQWETNTSISPYVIIDCGTGNDTVTITGLNTNETWSTGSASGTIWDSSYSVEVRNAETITVDGAGGSDTAKLYDSAGNDTFTASPGEGQIDYASGTTISVENFEAIHSYATAGGTDTAYLSDSTGNDTLYGSATETALYGSGYYNRAKSFESVTSYATAGGTDTGNLYDGTTDDNFTTQDGWALLEDSATSSKAFSNRAEGFDTIVAHADNGGLDVAKLYDSSGDDTYTAEPTTATLSLRDGLSNEQNYTANDFEATHAYANYGGSDTAFLYDSTGNDTGYASPSEASLYGTSYYNRAKNFETVTLDASTGTDTAEFYDSTDVDLFEGYSTYATIEFDASVGALMAVAAETSAVGSVELTATETALTATATTKENTSASQKKLNDEERLWKIGFEHWQDYLKSLETKFKGRTLDPQDFFEKSPKEIAAAKQSESEAENESPTDQLTRTTGSDSALAAQEVQLSSVVAMSSGTEPWDVKAQGFDAVHAYATATSGGEDVALLYDTTGNDTFVARLYNDGSSNLDDGALTGTGYYNRAKAFEQVIAYATGGTDTAQLWGNDATASITDGWSGGDNWVEWQNTTRSFVANDFDYVQASKAGVGTMALNAIANVTANEDDANDVFNLTGTFTSPTFQTAYNSNPTLVAPSYSGAQVTLDYQNNQYGNATIAVRGVQGSDRVYRSFGVSVAAVNDAPVLNAAYSPVLTSINEDITSPAGNTVAEIVANGSITDVDVTTVPEAIAITWVASTYGDWQYQLAGTSTWTTFTASTRYSRLLNATDRVRFVPDPDYNGSTRFTFRAWDQTTGTHGQTANTTSTGGTTAFSATYDSAYITVNAVNDAPVLNAAYSPVLTAIDEDVTTSAGNTVASIVVDGSITDPDVTPAPEAIAITSVDNANGDWQYQLSGTSTWTTFTATTAASRLLSANDKVRFVPDANYNGSASFTFRAWDQTTGTHGQTASTASTGGTTAFSSVADTATITVTAVNDAPVLNASYSPVLTAIDEDDTTSAGNTVASIVVNGSITDPDVTPAPEAIAITAVDNANGDWQYQLSGTSTWTTFTATTAASRLLSVTDKVRFVPDANFNGSANFTFRAWDQTTGTAGQTANTTSTGGTTAFSSVADTATITVTAVNDAPVLNASYSPVLTAIDEDDTTSAGNTVASIVVNGSITDPDVTPAPEAIAITAVDNANGDWQYQLSGTSTWTTFTATTAASRLLSVTDKIRFVPDANYNGSASFTFRAWDQTTGTHGQAVSTASTGGTTAFSLASDTASITVNAVNDAPVLNTAYSPVLTAINEDVTTSAGNTVAEIVVNGSITDPDVATAPEAIAITSVDNANGDWQYQLSGTSTWTTFTATTAASRLLSAADKIRFVPDANYNGSANFTFRAWDQTTGTHGQTASTASTGGTTAFSSVADTATITVTAVNDAPVLNASYSPVLTTIDEDTTSPAGNTVASIVVNGSITDPDVTPAPEAIAITSVDNANGDWQYQLSGTSTWTTFTATTAASRLLNANDKVRFVPDANFNGSANFTFRAWDQTTGTAGQTANTTSTGGTTAFSSVADTATITVTAQPDPPVFQNEPYSFSIAENSAVGTLVGQITATDEDIPAQTLTYEITAGNEDRAFAINPSTGQITVADQDALDYEATSSYLLTVRVTDNGSPVQNDSATVMITVIDIHEEPVLDAIETAALSYTENQSPLALTGQLTVEDEDDTHLESATIQITGNYQSGEDVLAFTDTATITGSWNSTTGTLSLSGSATVAEYQAALRSVTYENTSDDPDPSTRTVSFTVNDGELDSNIVTRDVAITPVNDPPSLTVTNATVTTDEGTEVTNTGAFGDMDSATVTLTASVGTVTDNGDGTWSWTYTPSDGPDASQTVTITATDSDSAYTEVTFALVVGNVVPTLTVSGAAAVVIDEQYSLTLGALLDPGADTLASYTIDWGDGTAVATYDVPTDGLPQGNYTHMYEVLGTYTISVTLIDEDGTHPLAPLSVEVLLGVTIDGPASIVEGSPYELMLDSGSLTITEWTIDWGDGTTDTLTGDPSSAEHTYADGDASYLIAATASDGTRSYDAFLPTGGRPGELDTSFGDEGILATALGEANALAVQADGKFLVGGYQTGANGYDFALTRYEADGSVDTTFGGTGTVVLDFAGGNDVINAVIVQPDGKILVAGYAYDSAGQSDFALARYDWYGSLDTDFGTEGKLILDFDGEDDGAWSVALQSDGKIVVAGYAVPTAGQSNFALARFDAYGELDTDFGTDGTRITDFAAGADRAYALAIQPDDKIVVAGYANETAGGDNFALVRYEKDGALDGTFDADGMLTTDFAGSGDRAYAVAIQQDGKIVVAGRAEDGLGGVDFALARYEENGTLDTTFDADGMLTTDFGGNENYAYALAIQADGKIVVAGYTNEATGGDNFALSRYEENGTLDTTFGTSGKLTTDFGSTSERANALAILPDGRILVAGSNGASNVVLACYRAGAGRPVVVENVAPTLTVVDDQVVYEGQSFSLTDLAVFTDPGFDHATGSPATVETFSYSIDWGDDSALTTGSPTIDVTGEAGVLTEGSFDGSHTYAEPGIYTVVVTISDDDGGSDVQSFVIHNGIPYAATGLSVTEVVSNTQVDLAWTDNAASELGFVIEKSTDGTTFAFAGWADADATSCSVTGLDPDTQYWLRVAAYNDIGTAPSAAVTATTTDDLPLAPTTLTVDAVASSQVELSWTVDPSSQQDGFVVEQSTDGTNFTEVATTVGSDGTGATVTDLLPSTTYWFRVRAYNGMGDSGTTGAVEVETTAAPPATPTGLAATAASTSQVNLTWTAGSADHNGFRVEQSTDGVEFTEVATAWGTAFVVGNLAPNTPYYFRVQAYNSAGTSEYSTAANATTPAALAAPAAPTNLTATPVSGTVQMALAWGDNSDNEAGFKIWQSTAGGAYAEVATTQPNCTSWTLTDLEPGAEYSFYVTAFNHLGNSTSNTVTATTNNVDVPPTVATAAAAEVDTAGVTAALSVLGDDDDGEEYLTYTWAATMLAPGAETISYSANGTNAAKSTTVTVDTAGTYWFTVTITDGDNLSTTSSVAVTVDQIPEEDTQVGMSLTPNTVSLDAGATQQFTVAGITDQFGDPVSASMYTWSATSGTIDEGGLYTAPDATGSDTVTVTCGSLVLNSTVAVTNHAPTVSTAAAATQVSASATAALSVLGADDADESHLTYTWAVLSKPSGADDPTFTVDGSENGTNAAKQAVATFTSLGDYEFQVTITDGGGLSVTDTVAITIVSTLTTIDVTPSSVSMDIGSTQQFTAVGLDQFGNAMVTQPTFSWSTTAGSIDDDGLYTAPGACIPATVVASADGVSDSVSVALFNSSPTTSARTGDSWMQAWWEESMGSPDTRQDRLARATGTHTLSTDTLSGGFVVDPTATFTPTILVDAENTSTIISSTTNHQWQVDGVEYASVETISSTLYFKETFDETTDEWTYIETFTLSYGIDTTVDGEAFSSVEDGSYIYTFEASGDAAGSSYTFTVDANDAPVVGTADDGAWSQNIYTIETPVDGDDDETGEVISNNSTGTVPIGTHSAIGGTAVLYPGVSMDGYSYGDGDDQTFDYDLAYTWDPTTETWIVTGTASTTKSDSGSTSDSYTDDYSDSGVGWSYSETTSLTSSDFWSYSYTTDYSLSGGTWQITGGSGSSSGDGTWTWNYNGDGNYWPADADDAMAGTFTNTGYDSTTYEYETTATYQDGHWTESGSGHVIDVGNSHYSYNGSGSYSNEIGLGSQDENGYENTSYSSTVDYVFDGGSWQLASGTAEYNEDRSGHWGYTTSAQSGDTTTTDTSQENGFEHYKIYYGLNTTTGLWKTTGAEANGNGNESWSRTVDSPYSASETGVWSVTGTSKQTQGSGTSYEYSGSGTVSGDDWSYSGTGWITSSTNSTYSYAGSGDYTDGTDTGTAKASGRDEAYTGYTTDYELDASDGTWDVTARHKKSSGNGFTDWSYSISEDYTSGYITNGTRCEGGGNHTSYDYLILADRTEGSTWVYDEDESYTTRSHGTSDNTSYSGSYSGNFEGYVTGRTIEGTIQEGGQSTFDITYTTRSEINADGTWKDPTETKTVTDNNEDHWSYTGEGEYSRSNTAGSSNDYLGKPRYVIDGTIEEGGHDDYCSEYQMTSERGTTGNWSPTGGRGYEESDKNSYYSYSGSGSFSDSVHETYTGGATYDKEFESYAEEEGSGDYSEHHVTYSSAAGGGWTSGSTSDFISRVSEATYDYTADETEEWSGRLEAPESGDSTEHDHYTSHTLKRSGSSYDASGLTTWDEVSGSGTATLHRHTNSYYTGTATDVDDKLDAWSMEVGADNIVHGHYTYDHDVPSDNPDFERHLAGAYGESEQMTLTSPGFYTHPTNPLYCRYRSIGSPPISGYPSAPSHSFSSMAMAMTMAAESTLGELSTATLSLDASPLSLAMPAATTSFGSLTASALFSLPVRTGGPSFGSVAATPSNAAFDAAGRLTSLTDRTAGVTRFGYDTAGNLASLTDPVENTTQWVYDEQDRVTEQVDPLGNSQYYAYNDAGDLVRYTDRNGEVCVYQYDGEHRVVAEIWYANTADADAGENAENTILYTYDTEGRITSEADDFSSTTYVYTDDGRLASVTESSLDGPTVVLAYQYNDAGLRTATSATIDGVADYVDEYTYDADGNLVSIVQHGVDQQDVDAGNAVAEKQIDLAYNDAGQLVSVDRYLDGQLAVEADYSYDTAGRLIELVYHQGATILASYAWTYSDSGSPLPLAGEGQGVRADDATTWFPTGGLMPLHDTADITTALLEGSYAAVDLLTSCTSIDGTATYSYDPTGQLVGVDYTGQQDDEAYSYDANGNRITANGDTYVTGANNQLLSDGTYWYTYDAEGNRTTRFVDVNGDGLLNAGDTDVTQYAWDNRGRLVEVVQRETFGGDPTQVVDYLYDVENRWIGENIDFDGDGLVDRQLRFVYDGTQIVLQFETEGEGAVTGEDLSHRYLWQANAVDQLLADEQLLPSPASGRGVGGEGDPTMDDSTAYDQSTPGQVLWPLTDQLGTVRDLAAYDAETGTTAVANHIVYDAYGRVTSETNAAVDSLFAFTGRALDPATGLQNNWNRWYDAKVGQWISEDPIGFEGRDANLCRYVGNATTTSVDPSGLQYNSPYPGTGVPYGPIPRPGSSQNPLSVRLKWKEKIYEVKTIKVQSGTFRVRGVLSGSSNYVDISIQFTPDPQTRISAADVRMIQIVNSISTQGWELDGAADDIYGQKITTPYWKANQFSMEWFVNGKYIKNFPATGVQNNGKTAWMLDQPGGAAYSGSFITLVVYKDPNGNDVPLAYIKWSLNSHAGMLYSTYTLTVSGAGDGEPTVQGNLKFFDVVKKSIP